MVKTNYVFILGVGRTGSKIYMNILNSSDEISILPEIKFYTPYQKNIIDLYNECNRLKNKKDTLRFVNLLWKNDLRGEFWRRINSNEININNEILYDKLWETERKPKNIFECIMEIFSAYNNTDRTGAKFPVHFSFVDTLLEWFPECKIIHTTRDPRATSISHAKNLVDGFGDEIHYLPNYLLYKMFLIHGTIDWIWASNFHKKLNRNENYYLSRFEDLILKPEKQIREICRFIDIKFDDEMMRPPMVDSSYNRKIKRGFDKSTLNRWVKNISKPEKTLINTLTMFSRKRIGYN